MNLGSSGGNKLERMNLRYFHEVGLTDLGNCECKNRSKVK